GLDLIERAYRREVGPGSEVAVADLFVAARRLAPLGLPGGNAAIEDGDVMSAKGAQHPPGARRGVPGGIIVEDDAATVAEPQALHAAGE
nr:hypothetical protein [Tanacetum cinerariifolium]